MLKRWFIEPKPNVFVGSLSRRTRDKALQYIRRNAPGLGMLIMTTEKNSQGFAIRQYGETPRRPVRFGGHFLVAEKWQQESDREC